MSGEYDCSGAEDTENSGADQGSKATMLANIRHFPMSENPALFKNYLMPVLDEIARC